MSAYIYDLIRQGENISLDFKHSITDSKKIARSLVAFANTQGGKLLIGVKDNGKISGIRTEEEYYMVEAAAHLHCRPEMPFKTETWDIKGKRILEVIIEKSNDNIYYALDNAGKWKAYVRVHDQNLLANKIQLNVWKRRKSPKGTLVRYSREEKVILDFLSSHETISISKFKKIAKISKFKAEKILINLIVLDLIEIIFTENGALYKLKAEK